MYIYICIYVDLFTRSLQLNWEFQLQGLRHYKSKLESLNNIFTMNRGIWLANLTPRGIPFQNDKMSFQGGRNMVKYLQLISRLTQEFGWEAAEWTRQSKSWVRGGTSGAWGGDQQCQCGAIGDVPVAETCWLLGDFFGDWYSTYIDGCSNSSSSQLL